MTAQPVQPNQQAEPWQMMVAGGLIVALLGLFIMLLPMLAPQLALGANLLGGEKAAWFLSRSSGTVAYLMMTASTVWGLLLSTKLAKQLVSPAIALAMHNYLSWLSVGLTVFHAVVLLFDSYFTYTLGALLIPFTGPYSPIWVGLGTIGFYILLITMASYYVRKQIGQKTWRKLHYTTFGAYILSTLHGWMAGTDAAQLAVMYGASSILVLFLTLYRILSAGESPQKRRRPA